MWGIKYKIGKINASVTWLVLGYVMKGGVDVGMCIRGSDG